MNQQLTRALSVVAAVSMLAAGVSMVVLGSSSTPAQAAGTYFIDLLPSGPNPAHCTVNRLDSVVKFINKDTKPHRLVVELVGSPTGEFRLDTGVLQPGETQSGGWLFSSQDRATYRDIDDAGYGGVIEVPIEPNTAAVCSPLPPTPTPTNTPTITPTPTATPTKPPTPLACARLLNAPRGCNLAPAVSSDGPLE